MTSTFRLGRIGGIDIGVHWSWVAIVGLLVWSLAAGVFPETNPGLSDGTYVAMAAVAVPLFFACLVAHELGHALQARRDGMQIEGITLWVLGGVARFAGRFPSAPAEFRIAVAGPAVSAALGVVLLAAALLVPLPSAVDGTLHWLGYINLLLLAFNLLPALPLDGGRVLRSLLWWRSGDFQAATRRAAAIGTAFGQVLIAGGILVALSGGGLGGLWFALIGWFLLGAASAEAADARAQAALAGVRVADAMTPHPVVVDAGMSVLGFVEDVVLTQRHTAYPVLDGGRPAGLVSFRGATLPPRETWATATVRDRMTPLSQCLVVAPADALGDVLADLLSRPDRRALVVDRGRLAGLLTAIDVMRLLEIAELAIRARGAADTTDGRAPDPRRRGRAAA